MKTIMVEFTDGDARYLAWYLRKRYGKDKRTPLRRLCEIAIRKEVADEARKELAALEAEL